MKIEEKKPTENDAMRRDKIRRQRRRNFIDFYIVWTAFYLSVRWSQLFVFTFGQQYLFIDMHKQNTTDSRWVV